MSYGYIQFYYNIYMIWCPIKLLSIILLLVINRHFSLLKNCEIIITLFMDLVLLIDSFSFINMILRPLTSTIEGSSIHFTILEFVSESRSLMYHNYCRIDIKWIGFDHY